jgi:hypothetical protein
MNSDMAEDYDSERVTASSDPDHKDRNLPVFSASAAKYPPWTTVIRFDRGDGLAA